MTLCDPELVSYVDRTFLCWGGDVRSADAYQVGGGGVFGVGGGGYVSVFACVVGDMLCEEKPQSSHMFCLSISAETCRVHMPSLPLQHVPSLPPHVPSLPQQHMPSLPLQRVPSLPPHMPSLPQHNHTAEHQSEGHPLPLCLSPGAQRREPAAGDLLRRHGVCVPADTGVQHRAGAAQWGVGCTARSSRGTGATAGTFDCWVNIGCCYTREPFCCLWPASLSSQAVCIKTTSHTIYNSVMSWVDVCDYWALPSSIVHHCLRHWLCFAALAIMWQPCGKHVATVATIIKNRQNPSTRKIQVNPSTRKLQVNSINNNHRTGAEGYERSRMPNISAPWR